MALTKVKSPEVDLDDLGIVALQSDVSTLQTSLDTLQTTVGGHTAQIGTLESNVSTLQTTTTDHGTRITALETNDTAQDSAITALQAAVANQQGATTYIGTVNATNAAVTANTGLLDTRASELGRTPLQVGYTLTDTDGHEWRYEGSTLGWVDTGYFGVQQATNSSLGIVKGTATDLGISVALDGTMSVNGLSDALSGKVDKVTGKGLSTNDYDATAVAQVAKIATLETDLSSLTSTVSGHTSSISTINSTIGDIQTVNTAQGTAITNLQTAIAAITLSSFVQQGIIDILTDSASGSVAAFTLNRTPLVADKVDVYKNGLKMAPNTSGQTDRDYTLANGVVTFNTNPRAGSRIWAQYYPAPASGS